MIQRHKLLMGGSAGLCNVGISRSGSFFVRRGGPTAESAEGA
ncbi:MAG: hypothetical protein ACJAVI_002058 [Candidatus Azotimanducaceae bacterium]|jgi:hypothetical protein